jgi:GAF domain-containing protein
LKSGVDMRLGTGVKLLAYAAVPIVPTLTELLKWDMWQRALPFLPTFHIIYWWAALTLGVVAYEAWEKTKTNVQWLGYWNERARILAGNIEEIGEILLHRRQDGRPPSPDLVIAGVLQQISDVVRDLTKPPPGVHIMACMLYPVCEDSGPTAKPVALQAAIYNQNAGRNKSCIPLDLPGPACEAYNSGRTVVVADTSAEPYREQFAGKPYKSVVAFPVNVGNKTGRRIAVVTVDATAANTFTEELVEERGIEAAIFPYLKLIGVTRIAEQRGGIRGRN